MNDKIIEQAKLSPNPESALTILNFLTSRSAVYGASWQADIEFHLWQTLQDFNPEILISFGLEPITMPFLFGAR